ncbi:MAG: hypothetical protein JNG84_13690, partial [Archangium sp.]|nr:hypothetical protein [Archangium sp.]
MPLAIKDRKLSTLYTSFEQQRASNPSLRIGATQVLQILAEVADAGSKDGAKLLAELKKPGLTRPKQVELIQKGMTAEEKKDLTAILDKGSVPLEADAKAFLQAVLGRGAVPQGPALQLSGDQKTGLSGLTKPGATIEAINLSAAPGGRLHLDDTVQVGKADASGTFTAAKLTGEQVMKQGDLIRLRARYADGTTSDWLTVAATGIAGTDTRNAVVAMARIGLTDAGAGTLALSNTNSPRPVSEPGAKLQFVNKRTGEKTVITLDANGTFPAGSKLKGKPGDTFSVAASDGKNNATFATAAGNLTVAGSATGGDLVADPVLHRDEMNANGTPQFAKARFTSPLFKDGVSPGDVRQGALANCYFPGAIAAVAATNPEVIRDMVKDNGNGTYTVTFKQMDWTTRTYKPVP